MTGSPTATSKATSGTESYRFAPVLRGLSLLLTFVGFAALLGFLPSQGLERGWGLEALYALRGTRPPPPEVTVIAIQSEAARALEVPARPDRWPRALHAELVERLHAHGARVVAFDLLFDRPREAEGDRRLAEALRLAQNVILVAYLQRETVAAGGAQVSVDRLIEPLPAFAEAALSTAPFALVKSNEGVLEYLPFAPEGDDHPSLPLVMAARWHPEALAALPTVADPALSPARALAALRREAHGASDGAIASPLPGDAPATRAWRRLLSGAASPVVLNLYGPPGQVRTIPYDRAIEALRRGGADADVFRGGVVLVGASEFNQPEQRDVYRTPWSTADGLDVSGVELAATAVSNHIDGSTLRRLAPWQDAALMAGLAALMWLPWRLLPTRVASGVSLTVGAGYGAAALAAFTHAFVWLPVAGPLFILWPVSVLLGLGLRLRELERQRQRLREALSRYGPREEIARVAHELRRGDDTVHVACLSTDIVDYTRRVEGREPADARRWLNRYYETVFPIVRRHGGHVVDHAGDAMVCIWLCGADAGPACVAAVNAARELHARLNDDARAGAFDPEAFPTRIGLHFGPVALGDVGDAEHAEQRVVGDIVNTASRIESANKTLGTRVLISDAVAAHLADGAAPMRRLGAFMLTGKSQPLGLVDPLAGPEALHRLHQEALRAWVCRDDVAFESALRGLLADWPGDGPSRFLEMQWKQALSRGTEAQSASTPMGDRPPFALSLK